MTTILVPRERRVVLNGVSWESYQRLVREVEDNGQRLTFDRGRLEIMSPSPRHEKVKTVLARLIEAYSDAMNITVEGLGSTTFAREDLQKGLEPDECYYIANAQAVVGKEELDLTVDPPPDLAIEIDISPPDVQRQPIYAALGVPEVWRYDGSRVISLRRDGAGNYSMENESLAFPLLSIEMLNELVTIGLAQGQSAAVAELRRRLRAM